MDLMPEGIVDSGRVIDAGVDARRRPPRERPADVPEDWVRDRKTGTWREPRKRGPKRRELEQLDEVPAGDVAEPESWSAERDPEPARLSGESNAPATLPKTEKEALEDAAAVLGLGELFLLAPLARVDPYCAGALADNYANVVDKSLPLIARSPRLLRWLSAAGGGKDWIMFAAALKPVATAVVAHHVTKTVHLDGDEPGVDVSQYPAAATAA